MKRDCQKAIIFDIDGTAIDTPSVRVPTTYLVKTIQKASASFYMSAATGRAWSFANPALRALKLVDPCIITGGTQICDPVSGKILWQCVIEPKGLAAILAILSKHGKRKLFYTDYTLDDYLEDRGAEPAGLKINEPVSMINYTYVSKDDAYNLAQELSGIPGIICTLVASYQPGLFDMHISNVQATKEHAVVELCKMLGIGSKDTIGVGDGHNDLHLFNAAGTKVAMGNAVPELKAAADVVIGSVKDDGLAHYINELV